MGETKGLSSCVRTEQPKKQDSWSTQSTQSHQTEPARCRRRPVSGNGGTAIWIFTWLHGEESSLLSPRRGSWNTHSLAEVDAPMVRLHVGHGQPATGISWLWRQGAVIWPGPLHLGPPGALISAAEYNLLACRKHNRRNDAQCGRKDVNCCFR